MNHANKNTEKRLDSNGAFFSFVPQKLKNQLGILLAIWYLLLFFTTFIGTNKLLISPIHPLYLILSTLILPLLFLVLTVTKSISLFSSVFIWIWDWIQKRFSYALTLTQDYSDYERKSLLSRVSFIAHSSWCVIFISLTIALFVKFSLQHYEFYLSSTLFPNNTGIYAIAFNIINFLPELCGLLHFETTLIEQTLSHTASIDMNTQWARWILITIIFYGILPRLLFTLLALWRLRRFSKKIKESVTLPSKNGNVIDRATVKPTVERAKKKIHSGQGEYIIALDFPDTMPIQSNIRYLNDLTQFSEFEALLKRAPAQRLKIIIDASQTPDRGVLRRLSRLLNQTKYAEIYCIPNNREINRFSQWKKLLTPLLQDHESLYSKMENQNNE